MAPPDAGPPPELVAVLQARPDARAAYEALPPSHRREYDEWVAEARQPATRERRAAKAVDALLLPRRS